MSSEIIPNSIISFISAQLTQILGVSITTGKAAKWRPELDEENGNANTGSGNRVVSRALSRSEMTFPSSLIRLTKFIINQTELYNESEVISKLVIVT